MPVWVITIRWRRDTGVICMKKLILGFVLASAGLAGVAVSARTAHGTHNGHDTPSPSSPSGVPTGPIVCAALCVIGNPSCCPPFPNP